MNENCRSGPRLEISLGVIGWGFGVFFVDVGTVKSSDRKKDNKFLGRETPLQDSPHPTVSSSGMLPLPAPLLKKIHFSKYLINYLTPVDVSATQFLALNRC